MCVCACANPMKLNIEVHGCFYHMRCKILNDKVLILYMDISKHI